MELLRPFNVFVLGLLATTFVVDARQPLRARLNSHEIILYWHVNFTMQYVDFDVSVRGEEFDWLALGFSDHGKYEGSDLCTWKRGHKEMIDAHVRKDMSIHSDLKQDCQFIHVNSKSDRIRFRRRFATCDPRDFALDFGTSQIILAIAPERPYSIIEPQVDKAIHYTTLLETMAPKTKLEKDHRVVRIAAANATVPKELTTYWCSIIKLDSSLQADGHHAIRVLDYPKEAGMPIGGKDYVPYLMVEIHYNNPYHYSGRVDNSGFDITVTKNLRPYDAGIIEFGVIYSDANSIPAGQSEFRISGTCVPECTKHLDRDGIYIFATQQHAHLTGRKIRTAHYRKGVKLGYVNWDDHYSPHWQVIRRLQNHVHVLPGDVIKTTCTFETKDLQKWTYGGYGIADEMCVNYVFYYPASKLEVCKTAISNKTLDRFFKKYATGNIEKMSISEKYASLKMDDDLADTLQEWYDVMPLKVDCLNHAGELFKGDWEVVSQPSTFSGSYEKRQAKMECPAVND